MTDFSTPKFAVTRRSLLRNVWLTGMSRYLAVVLIPIAAAVAAGIWLDARWYIVALMYLFICMPTMLMFIYFSKMLRPEMFVNTMPHTLRVRGRDIFIRADVMPYPDNDTDDEAKGESETKEDEIPVRQIDYRFRMRAERPLVMSTDALLLMLAPPQKGFIAVPNRFIPENNPK